MNNWKKHLRLTWKIRSPDFTIALKGIINYERNYKLLKEQNPDISVPPKLYWDTVMKEDCLFCKIIAGKIPAYKVYEDDAVFAFLDINPASEGHTLIAPKKHFRKFTDMNAEDVAPLFEVARKITAAVEKASLAEGSNIGINNGEAAGQEILHVHVHVIPRRKGDGGRGIKSIVWTEPDTTNLEVVAEKIRRAL